MSARRTVLALPPELKDRVREFRFANRINTETQAVRILIERGLAGSTATPKQPTARP